MNEVSQPASGARWENRLRRLDHEFIRDPVYFLTLCTEDRKCILARDEIHNAFVRFSKVAADRGVFVGKYVIMPDHLHLFVRISVAAVCDRHPEQPRGREHPLSMWVKSLKNSLSKEMRILSIPAPHWQKTFFDHILRSEESYIQKAQYMSENPVRAGLVQHAAQWKYSGEFSRLKPPE
jgi:putative transposase